MEKELKIMDEIRDKIFDFLLDLSRKYAEIRLKQEEAEKKLDDKGAHEHSSNCHEFHCAAIGVALLMERLGLIDKGMANVYVDLSEQGTIKHLKREKEKGI